MSRGHGPGCYCCNNIPPSEQCPTACCAEDEAWPTFAPGASWQLRIRTVSQDCCCVTAIYDYIDDPVKECCLPCGSYSYEMTNESNQYAFKKTQALIDFQTQCAPPSCLEECCQTGEPILIATWKTTITDHFNYFFAARIIFDSLEVKYGKELIECPGDNEPTCRYFMKYTIFGHYEARVDMEQVLNRKRELTYLHPCWVYNENFKSDCTPWVSSVECEYDETVIHRCVNPGEVCSWPINKCCEGGIEGTNQNCFRSFSTFCVERVRYFETPPSGQVGFTENDINTPPGGDPSQYCKDPYCDSNCNNGYISEIELRSGIPSPPYWYTNPPTVNSTSTTYLVEWDYCDLGGFPLNTTASAPSTCCDPQMYVSTQCPPDSCQNPSSEVTITCQNLDFNEETWNQEDECRVKSTVSYIGITDECGYIPGAIGVGVVGGVFENDGQCYFPFLGVWDRQHPVCGPWQGNCIQYVPTGDSSCNGDCYATQSCGGCFCRCVSLFVQAFFQSNAVSFTTSGSWNEQVCNYTGFNLSISVNL